MKVAIRCDASSTMGTGHVMRCLTLAEQLRSLSCEVVFISREHVGNMNDYIESHGYQLHRLPLEHTSRDNYKNEYARWLAVSIEEETDQTVSWLREQSSSVDWMIVDHYGLNEHWESAVRLFVGRIMVIDDLADRTHDCDLLLDQNRLISSGSCYDTLVPEKCLQMIGPKFALLRPEFERMRTASEHRRNLRRLLLFYGGSDPTDETSKAVRALTLLKEYELTADVVVGQANPHRESVELLCRQTPGIAFHFQVDNMAELMTRASLSLGAGGVTTYERCCLGLPTLITAIADNQIAIGEGADQQGVARYLGRSNDVTAEMIAQAIEPFLTDATLAIQMSARARALVDGRGVQRVAEELFRLCERSVAR